MAPSVVEHGLCEECGDSDETYMLMQSLRFASVGVTDAVRPEIYSNSPLMRWADRWTGSTGVILSDSWSSSENSIGVLLLPVFLIPLLAAGIFACWWFRPFKPNEQRDEAPLVASRRSSEPSSSHLSVRQSSARPSLLSNRFPPHKPTALCPEMVVAADMECIFAVPALKMPLSAQEGMLLRNVTDKNGKALLRLALTRVPADKARSLESEYVMLTKLDETEMAFCELDVSNRGAPLSSIYLTTGDVYATVAEEIGYMPPSRTEVRSEHRSFMVTGVSPNPLQLRFTGDFFNRDVSVVAVNTGRRVAVITAGEDMPVTRTRDDCYQVRLGPNADGALILVALIVMDRLLAFSTQPLVATSPTLSMGTENLLIAR